MQYALIIREAAEDFANRSDPAYRDGWVAYSKALAQAGIMYDTFGDKRGLYLEALKRYNVESIDKIIADLRRENRPIEALEGALVAFASRPAAEARRGCLGVSAICEFGRTDAEIAALTDSAGHALHAAIESLLAEARRTGDLATEIDIADAIPFLGAALSGMSPAS